jgi:hypothetical protein
MRPQFCDRFIFMTSHRGNIKVNEFIASVNGMVLSKPFHVDDLLEMIAAINVRTLQNPSPNPPVPARPSRPPLPLVPKVSEELWERNLRA